MKGYIYKITNKVTGKSYIGQTRYTVEFRWRQHQHKKDGCYFHNSIQTYGVDNFTVETLEECDFKDLDSREMYYIAKYDTFSNGYNTTIGGDGRRKIVTDNQYEEIRGLYLSGFSCNKIAELYNVNKTTILKILHSLKVKIRKNNLDINRQEFEELVGDYRSGFSLRELAKRYGCTSVGLRGFLIKRGVDLRQRYNILDNESAMDSLIKDYLNNTKVDDIIRKYHCSYATFTKILSLHGIDRKGKGNHFKLSDSQCLEVIRLFNEGMTVQNLAKKFNVNKSTVYSLLKRYHVDYLTV